MWEMLHDFGDNEIMCQCAMAYCLSYRIKVTETARRTRRKCVSDACRYFFMPMWSSLEACKTPARQTVTRFCRSCSGCDFIPPATSTYLHLEAINGSDRISLPIRIHLNFRKDNKKTFLTWSVLLKAVYICQFQHQVWLWRPCFQRQPSFCTKMGALWRLNEQIYLLLSMTLRLSSSQLLESRRRRSSRLRLWMNFNSVLFFR